MIRAFVLLSLFAIGIANAHAEGAVARGDLPRNDVLLATSHNQPTRQLATEAALAGCRKRASNCTIIGQFRNTCMSAVRSPSGEWFLGHGATPREAWEKAVQTCRRTQTPCVQIFAPSCDTIIDPTPVATTPAPTAAATVSTPSIKPLLHTQSASVKFHRHAEFASLCGAPDYTVSVTWQSPASDCRDCNRYTLTCRNGASHALVSWDSPFSTTWDVVVSRASSFGMLLVIIGMFVVALVARFGPHELGRDLFLTSFAYIIFAVIAGVNLGYAKYLPDSIWYSIGLLFSYATLAVLGLFVFMFGGPFIRGFHYLFVPHPAAARIEPSLRFGAAIDGGKLADALTPDLDSLARPPPVYQSRNQAARAEALAEKMRRDTQIAEAAERLARAKAAAADAKRELKERQGRSKWRTILTFGRG